MAPPAELAGGFRGYTTMVVVLVANYNRAVVKIILSYR